MAGQTKEFGLRDVWQDCRDVTVRMWRLHVLVCWRLDYLMTVVGRSPASLALAGSAQDRRGQVARADRATASPCLRPSGPLPNASVEARTRLGVRLCAAMQRLPQTSRRASGPRGAFSAKGRDAGLRIHLLVPVGTEGQRGTSILNGTSHMNSGTGYSLRAPPARGHWSANYGHIRTRDSLVDAVPFA